MHAMLAAGEGRACEAGEMPTCEGGSQEGNTDKYLASVGREAGSWTGACCERGEGGQRNRALQPTLLANRAYGAGI